MIQIISDLIAGEHIFILVHTLEIHVQTMTFISLDKSGRGWAGLDAPNHKDSLKKKNNCYFISSKKWW